MVLNFLKSMGLGELPPGYNKAIHGYYMPWRYYGPKDTPLSQVQLRELPSWFARRSKNPIDWGRAMSRAYWRWNLKYLTPRYSKLVPLNQMIVASALFYYWLNYRMISHHRHFKYHW